MQIIPTFIFLTIIIWLIIKILLILRKLFQESHALIVGVCQQHYEKE